MIILQPNTFRFDFQSKLLIRKKELEPILSDLKIRYQENTKPEISEIEVGCRVLATYEDGLTVEGRVWGIKNNGTLIVNRDGYKSIMNFEPNMVKNLSIGIIGVLEKQIWQIQTEIEEIESLIGTSCIPTIFIDNQDSIVEVVKINKELYIDSIEFVHGGNLKSYKIHTPKNAITELGYYHIGSTQKGELICINKSSEFAFKTFYKSNNL